MKLEFWLDYLSPLCYQQHLALEKLYATYRFDDLELLYRSYEMIPSFEPKATCSLLDVLQKHHVLSMEETHMMFKNETNYPKPVQVMDAHRLSHLAKKLNLAFDYNKAIFKAYYVNKKDISNHQVLKDICKKVGLNSQKVEDVLSSQLFEDAVKMNRENAILKGIFEIPHLRVDGKIRLMGYHNEQMLMDALTQASIKYVKKEFCEGENCERKKTR